VVAAPLFPAVVVARIVCGLGRAVGYDAGRYHVMRVRDAVVLAASTHEGLIGVGYGVGPAAALVGVTIGGVTAVVAASLMLPAATLWPAIRPYLRGRRAERRDD
ncbi:MAG: hypothetical protein GY825_10745, partial [Phycisphaeraceae bacterium]|nr:hypothetical protein [Phycisphaeraceae bacterium]